ncbi:MAG TPA: Gfo/Idh/MocA family oxidoreductase [Candidatus Glassbacteria bacterium]|nr:Gfo/Idh/MocA family oxidoreductase [Candidatus Glassbacteria bacterium]
MNPNNLDRRDFLKKSAAAAALAAIPSLAAAQSESAEKPVRVGFIGVGSRGTVLLRFALLMPGVEIPAICDIDESHLGRAQRLVERRGLPTPAGYSKGPEDFRRMFEERHDLDAVICATPWNWHAPMMVAAMQAGVYAGVEVPAAVSIDEGWQLVETSEKTGVPLMMIENYCYFRSVLLTINLLDLGLFGDLVHCEVGYQKDERNVRIGPNGELGEYGELKITRDGNLYPTHAIGPAGWAMGINRGDRFSYLVSMSSRSEHLELFAREKFGPDHPAAKIDFKNGDVNISLIRSELGRTVTLYYDTQ